jgi:hypothetical protein
MSFETGKQKTGGRMAGTPNKRTTQLIETLDGLNIDLPTKILELLPTLLPEKQVDVLLHLMPYVYPKRKAVELDVHDKSERPWWYNMMLKFDKMTPEQRNQDIDQLIASRAIIKAEEKSIAEVAANREKILAEAGLTCNDLGSLHSP